MSNYETEDVGNDDGSGQGRGGVGISGGASGASGMPPNNSYASAMANLAGFPYSAGQVVNPASAAAFLNPVNFSSSYAAAQYNAAIAAGYWGGPPPPSAPSSGNVAAGSLKDNVPGGGTSPISIAGEKNPPLIPKSGKSMMGPNSMASNSQI